MGSVTHISDAELLKAVNKALANGWEERLREPKLSKAFFDVADKYERVLLARGRKLKKISDTQIVFE